MATISKQSQNETGARRGVCAVAHPDHRDGLRSEAKRLFYP